ncbi:MAG: hypothetical protein ACHQ4H_16430 [Ktedonobacterales bacterium]
MPADVRQVAIVCLLCAVALALLAVVYAFVPRQRHGIWRRKSVLFTLVLSALSLFIVQRAWVAYLSYTSVLSFAPVHLATTWQLEHYFGAAYDNSIRPMVSNFRLLMVLDVVFVACLTLSLLFRTTKKCIAWLHSRHWRQKETAPATFTRT